MDPEMTTLYPAGVRVLLVDDDVRFLKAASMLLSLLNFQVSTCQSLSSALRFLTAGDKYKEIDVVLADAKKATTCGFDFRAIVEPDLRVPVLYFLSTKHRSSGEEADALLRILELASFILKKPLEGESVCCLWRNIAWRKLQLMIRASLDLGGGGDAGQGSSSSSNSGGVRMLPRSPWTDRDDDEEERVHYRMVTGESSGRKRRGVFGGAGNPGSSSGSGGAGPAARRGRPAKKQKQEAGAVAGQQETDNVAPKPAPRKYRSRKDSKPMNNGASPSMPVIPETVIDVETYQPTRRRSFEKQPSSQQAKPKKSRFVQNVLKTLPVLPHNPSIFAAAVEPGTSIINFSGAAETSSSIISFSGSGSGSAEPVGSILDFSDAGKTTAAGARAPSPVVNPAPTTPASPAPVNQAPQAPASPALVNQAPQAPPAPPRLPAMQAPPAPAPAGNVAPAAEGTTISVAAVTDKQLCACASASQKKQQQHLDKEASLPLLLRGAFGPFPYQGPPQPPPVMQQQDMFGGAPPCNFAAGNGAQLPFQQPAPIAGAGDPFACMAAGGGAAITGGAANAVHSGNYGNNSDDTTLLQPLPLSLAAAPDNELEAMLAVYATGDQHMAPQAQHVDVAPLNYNNNEAMYNNNNNNNAEPFMAPHQQVLAMVPYGVNDPAMEAGRGGTLDDVVGNANAAANFMAPQGFGAEPNMMNQLVVADAPLAMFDPSVENEDDFSFPLAALLGTDEVPMYDGAGGLAGLQGGAADNNAVAAAVNAAENYLNGEEGGMEDWGLAPADGGAGIFGDMLMDNLLPHYMNNGRE